MTTTVRSISGAWMKVIAKHAFPERSPRGRIESLATTLQISRRSCYAYVAEERRVPEDVERRFIALFGEPTDDAWRTVELQRPRKPKKRRKMEETRRLRGITKEMAAATRAELSLKLRTLSGKLSEDGLGHVLEWEQNQLTIGQTAMLEESLDEQEARAKYPHNFDTLAMSEDWVAICKSCGLIGAVDESAREVNGLVFRVTCRSDSYRVQ